MKFLIDAYNLFFYVHSEALSHKKFLEKKEAFIQWFTRLAPQHHYILVLDGGEEDFPQKKHLRHIELIYAPKNQSADQCIVNLLDEKYQGKVYVVTNDREILNSCRAFHTPFMKCQAFIDFTLKKENEEEPKACKSNDYLFNYYLNAFEKRLKDQDE